MKVISWRNSSSYESYLVMKVEIGNEVKRSDGLWRFACGDVYTIPPLSHIHPIHFVHQIQLSKE